MVWTKLPLFLLYSAQNCTYVSCIWRRTALTFSKYGAKPSLQKQWSGQNVTYKNHSLRKSTLRFMYSVYKCPCAFCTRHRTTLMVTVFSTELPLKQLGSGQNATYNNCGLDKSAPIFLYSSQNSAYVFSQDCTYIFCVRRRTALTKTIVWTKCHLHKSWFGSKF